MTKILESYVDKTIRIMGFEAKETIEMTRLCEECEEGIIPFEFVQRWFKTFVENAVFE